jgi:hypothetical protein
VLLVCLSESELRTGAKTNVKRWNFSLEKKAVVSSQLSVVL